MHFMKTKKRHGQAGFSMIEMLIVMAIIMVISAMALPNIINSVQIMRMRSTLTEITGLYQQTRRQAVRDSRIYPVKTTTTVGKVLFYADTSATGTGYVTGMPAIALPDGMSIVATPGTTTGINVDMSNVVGTLPSFNNRGLPCQYTNAYKCDFIATVAGNFVPSHFVIFLQSSNGGSMAVSVAPSGEVKGYIWSGASFQ
jgi:prepilin-type N-terminal cleavage/methylation domain-containing protein